MKTATLTRAPSRGDIHVAYDALLERLSTKAKAALTRREETRDDTAEPWQGDLWRRLAIVLEHLAPFGPDALGKQSLRFYIPDGKYRQQVFAIEETKTNINVYLPDVIEAAVAAKIIKPTTTPNLFTVVGGSDVRIQLDPISADTPDLGIVKPMLGWGRRALRCAFGPMSNETHIQTLQHLCEVAAKSFPAQPTA